MMDVVAGGEAVRGLQYLPARVCKWRPEASAALCKFSLPRRQDDEANKKISTDRKGQKYKARVYDSFPIRHWDKWLEDTQPHLFVQMLEPDAKAKDLLAGTKFVAAPGFGGSLGNSGDEINAVWTPDCQPIVLLPQTSDVRHTRFQHAAI